MFEGDETFTATLSAPTNAATLDATKTTATGTIVDFYNRPTSNQNETIIASSGTSVINVTTGSGSDTINLTNRTGNVVASEGLGADSIFGGSRNDVLDGGDDTILGNAGADRLFGGTGADTLTGGLGNDIFALETASGTDLILDFQSGDLFGLTGGLAFNDLSFVESGVNTNITNLGNVLAIVTGVSPSAIGVFVSANTGGLDTASGGTLESTTVPFEFEGSAGILTLSAILGINQWRKNRIKK